MICAGLLMALAVCGATLPAAAMSARVPLVVDVIAAGCAVAAYGTADGMNIRECSGDGHPAVWKLANGSLWFATLATRKSRTQRVPR